MSVTAAVVRELMAAGVTGDALVTALERIEAAERQPRSAAAERMIRYRQRLREEEASRDVTGDTAPSPKEKSPAPPKEITPSSSLRSQRPQRVRATRIPDDFAPDLAVAEELGLSPDGAQTEADAFVDYWRSKPTDATKLDWPATWRNWCRRAAKDRGRSTGPPASRPRSQNGFAAYAIDLARQDHDAAPYPDNGQSAHGSSRGPHTRHGPEEPGLLDTRQPDAAGRTHAGLDRR